MKTLKLLFFSMLSVAFFSCDPDDNDERLTTRPDLKAESIEYTFVRDCADCFNGILTLTGTVRNIGEDFLSREGAQSIVLFEERGTIRDRMAELDFVDLEAGGLLTLSYSTSWSLTEEFPPRIVLLLGYDLDITMDSIETNDDIDLDNNILIKHGYEITNELNAD